PRESPLLERTVGGDPARDGAGPRRGAGRARRRPSRARVAAARLRPAHSRRDGGDGPAAAGRPRRGGAPRRGRPPPPRPPGRRPAALSGIRPAAARALGEAARLQLREFYDASLDYGRSTTTRYGLYYVGAARAQREFIAFERGLPAPSPSKPEPPVRSIARELDALEDAILAAYR